ncbi:hypothetical protein E3N88_15358 [Mikania micrantha]|uniref:SUI1 domain-containing protein n=1 Tax=Mikania micrantha TaxID=192012 RepID=A0A5N6NWM9_9ASTR|nr:hypothetical protein E3N88_15358 [Mikania micrantha]
MVDIEVQIPSAFDPFADVDQDSSGGAGVKEYVHIRIQQRNGRKSLTTVQGLKKELSYEKILKDLKKEFCCNGTVVQDKELGKVIQLQGDQRKNVSTFLAKIGINRRLIVSRSTAVKAERNQPQIGRFPTILRTGYEHKPSIYGVNDDSEMDWQRRCERSMIPTNSRSRKPKDDLNLLHQFHIVYKLYLVSVHFSISSMVTLHTKEFILLDSYVPFKKYTYEKNLV